MRSSSIRVEHSGFPRINVSKFGQKFVNQVANPDDILIFYKQTKTSKKSSNNDTDNGPVIVDQKELNDRQILEESAVPIQTILVIIKKKKIIKEKNPLRPHHEH